MIGHSEKRSIKHITKREKTFWWLVLAGVSLFLALQFTEFMLWLDG